MILLDVLEFFLCNINQKYINFVKFVQTQFQVTIKIVRLDNENEFLSLQPFFTSWGIEFQRTCVYTPQQNGIVERKHCHISSLLVIDSI